MVQLAREVMYVDAIENPGPCFLAADIGGTNSNFGIFSLAHEHPILLFSLHYKSKNITHFAELCRQVVAYSKEHYGVTLEKACIGAAGIVYPHRVYAHPTNLNFDINSNDISALTGIKQILIINDFEAVALGFELIDPKSIIIINKGIHRVHANRAFIGAGTGLGASSLLWSSLAKRYLPVNSESGHADAAFYTKEEFEFALYLKNIFNLEPISWENILSGAGIQKIYKFLGTQKNYKETEITQIIAQSDFDPDKISFYASKDDRCKDTSLFYVKIYARFAKSIALQMLSLDGIFIAGGIASKNISMFFEPIFLEEFRKGGRHQKQLEQMPIGIISDYNVSLWGAVVAAKIYEQGLLR